MKQEVQQYNMCPINIITASPSSYVEVKVGTHTIFHLTKASKTQEVKSRISHDIYTKLWLLYLVRGNIFLQITGILQSL